MTRTAQIAASRAQDSNIEVLAPEGRAYLPFQLAGIEYARTHNNVLFADEMGLGKTIQAIGVTNDDHSIHTVLVVCPAFLKLNWRDEIMRWHVRTQPEVCIITAGDKPPEIKALMGGGRTLFVCCNYDILHRYPSLMEGPFDMLIADEVHYAKNEKTRRGAALHKVRARRKLALTGTPILNAPWELWSPLKLLAPHLFKNKYAFLTRYCDGKNTGWGFEAKGCTNAEELQRIIRASVMVRRLKADVLKELPEKRHQLLNLPTTKEIRLVLDRELNEWTLHEEVIAKLRERRVTARVEKNDEGFAKAGKEIAVRLRIAFEAMAKMRVELAWLKLPLVVQHAKDMLESCGKLVVFWHHKEQAKEFAKQMGQPCITGDTPMDERHETVAAFQDDPSCTVLTGTIGAMGTGVTLTAGSNVLFAEIVWQPGVLAQAGDRCHRIGQHNSVLCQYLLFDRSVDSNMMAAILEKMENAKKVLDRDPGDAATPPEAAPVARVPRPVSEWAELGKDLSGEDCEAIHAVLRKLASLDGDRARTTNGAGFSKYDSRIGHELAEKPYLTKAQAAYARQMCRRYHRQLGMEDKLVLG